MTYKFEEIHVNISTNEFELFIQMFEHIKGNVLKPDSPKDIAAAFDCIDNIISKYLYDKSKRARRKANRKYSKKHKWKAILNFYNQVEKQRTSIREYYDN